MSTNLRLSDGIFMDYLQTSLPYRSYSLFDNKHLKYNVMRKKNYTSPFCEVYPLNEEGALLVIQIIIIARQVVLTITNLRRCVLIMKAAKRLRMKTISYKRVRGVLQC